MAETDQTPLEIIEENAGKTGTYTGALLVFMPVVPIIAAIASIVTFVVLAPTVKVPEWPESIVPLLVGTGVALLLWLLPAWFYRGFTTVHRANEKSYSALLEHLSALDYYMDAWLSDDTKKATLDMLHRVAIRTHRRAKSGQPSPAQLTAAVPKQVGEGTQVPGSTSRQTSVTAQAPGTSAGQVAGDTQVPAAAPVQLSSKDSCSLDPLQEVLYYRNAIYLALMQRSISWIVGYGYSALWDLMDSAEESLIIVAPEEKVVADAVYDEMRLNDSKIVNSEEWTNKLRSAVKMLDPNAERYLKPAVGTQPQQQASQVTGAQLPAGNQTGGVQPQQQALQAAGAQLPAGNQTGGVQPQQQIVAHAILRQVRKTINDYNANNWDGLISARNQLLSTMVLVGLTTYVFVELAILLGVKLPHLEVAAILAFIGALSGLIGRLSTESQSDTAIDDYRLSRIRLMVTPLLGGLAAVIGVLFVAKASQLGSIYNFNTLVANMIIAATFGWSPNLLINQMQKKSEGYKTNLQSTQPTAGK